MESIFECVYSVRQTDRGHKSSRGHCERTGRDGGRVGGGGHRGGGRIPAREGDMGGMNKDYMCV